MKWEYLAIKPHADLEKREFAFNTLGEDGWELVSVNGGIAYFKRKKPFEETKHETGQEGADWAAGAVKIIKDALEQGITK